MRRLNQRQRYPSTTQLKDSITNGTLPCAHPTNTSASQSAIAGFLLNTGLCLPPTTSSSAFSAPSTDNNTGDPALTLLNLPTLLTPPPTGVGIFEFEPALALRDLECPRGEGPWPLRIAFKPGGDLPPFVKSSFRTLFLCRLLPIPSFPIVLEFVPDFLEVVFVTSLIGSRVEGWSFTGGSSVGCEREEDVDADVDDDKVEVEDGRDVGGEGDLFTDDEEESEVLRGEGERLNVGIPEGIVDELEPEFDGAEGGEGDLLTTDDANCAGTGDGGL